MNRTEEIKKFVEENSSNTGDLLRDTWDALNVCMERLELAKRQTEIANTPDWSTAPDWANWRAMDADGRWYLFENKPIKSGTCWLKTTGQWALDYYEDRPWESSLQQRPQNKDQ